MTSPVVAQSTSRRGRTLALALVAALTSCGEDATAPARAALDRFAKSLAERNRDGLRDCLANDSIAALDQLLQSAGRDAGELEVAASAAHGKGRVDFEVRDARGQRGIFVVVRESGHWRVDLIESAVKSGGVTTGAGFEVHRGADPDEVAEAVARDSMRTR